MIDKRSPLPLYFQLAEEIKSKINSGEIKSGDKLPSESEMVERYDIGRLTVRSALAALVQSGYLIKQQGKGTFCRGVPDRDRKYRVAVLLNMNDNYFFQYYTQGISDALALRDIQFSLYNTSGEQNEIAALLGSLADSRTEQCDGILVQPSNIAEPVADATVAAFGQCAARGIPVMMIDCAYSGVEASYVICDEQRGGALAADYLSSLSHKQMVALICPRFRDARLRLEGFLKRAKELGLQPPIEASAEGDLYEVIFDAMKNGATACFCYNDEVALSLMRALKAHGVSVPKDLSIVSFDDSVIAASTEPPLSSIGHPKQLLGRLAANALADIITKRCLPPFRFTFEPELVVRGSAKTI